MSVLTLNRRVLVLFAVGVLFVLTALTVTSVQTAGNQVPASRVSHQAMQFGTIP